MSVLKKSLEGQEQKHVDYVQEKLLLVWQQYKQKLNEAAQGFKQLGEDGDKYVDCHMKAVGENFNQKCKLNKLRIIGNVDDSLTEDKEKEPINLDQEGEDDEYEENGEPEEDEEESNEHEEDEDDEQE